MQNPSFDNLNALNETNIVVVLDLLGSSQYDLTSCLSNCSNQGVCSFDALTRQYICACNSGFMGRSCQTDQKPCSKAKCLNNGTCLNVNNDTSYQCQCSSEIFYGEYCQYRKNLCEKRICSMNGNCLANHTESYCKCFIGYSGSDCEIVEKAVKIVKGIQMTSTIICAVCLVTFGCLVLCNDVLVYLKIGSEHIDIGKWKRKKLHGQDLIKKTKKKNQKKISKVNKMKKINSFLEPIPVKMLPTTSSRA